MTSEIDRECVKLPIGFIEQLGDATSLDELLVVSSQWIGAIIDVDKSSFALTSEDPEQDQALTLYSLNPESEREARTTVNIDGSMIDEAFRHRKTLNIGDLRTADFEETSLLLEAGLGSVLVVPMVTSRRVLGTINVGRCAPSEFTENEVLRLWALGSLVASSMAAQRRREAEHRRARIDELTGLLNRRAILETLRKRIDETDDQPYVLFLDLDGFKAINDAHGHAAGDALLIEVARRLQMVSRGSDVVGRIGGDEFLIICDPGTEVGAEAFAKRLVDVCSEPVEIGASRLVPRLSIGIATPGPDHRSTADLLAEADHAMYEAKRSAVPIIFTDDRIRAHAGIVASIDRDLGKAMATNEMGFFFQPIVSVETGDVVGAESLLRWKHPELGFIQPNLVLDRVEATGQIEEFTWWAVNRLASDWSRLNQEVPTESTRFVSLNLSPSQLGLRSYADWHATAVKRHRLAASEIVIEVVESGKVEVDAQSERTLRRLAENGARIALDDFGTGYNALSYLTQFPVHAVKFDRSLTSAVVASSQVHTIVRGLVAICEELGIATLAEGVETAVELDAASGLGMDLAQGYYTGVPMPYEAFGDLVRFSRPAELESTS